MYPRISDLFTDLFGWHVPLPLYTFGLMVATAILTAAWLARKELERMYAAGIVGPVTVKETDAKGRERAVHANPAVLMNTITILALVVGVAGSKLFHIIDYWDNFVADPVGMLFATSGLTFFGGLICAGLAIAWYARRRGLSVPRLTDAAAGPLILAYGIGRIGCYLSGDGDWGVCSQLEDKPGGLPAWLWSETFPRNLAGPGQTPVSPLAFNAAVRGENCTLASPDGVYPTMLYEFATCLALFGILWALRKHPFRAGWLFALYLVFAGLQRFTIEMIRVNPEVAFGLSQSQLISVGLVVAGLAGLAVTTRRAAAPPATPPSSTPPPTPAAPGPPTPPSCRACGVSTVPVRVSVASPLALPDSSGLMIYFDANAQGDGEAADPLAQYELSLPVADLGNRATVEHPSGGRATVEYGDALTAYAHWPLPVAIVSDGPYGVSGYDGDPPTVDTLPDVYEPHVAAWAAHSSPLTTLWFWNTELGWATVHPVLARHGWTFRNAHTWDKGIAHASGNSNTQTLRKLPVVTEICVQYVREATFRVGDEQMGLQAWLRHEWMRTGLPLYLTNEACGVKNAATRKYFTADHLWYFPPVDAFERLVAYANAHGRADARPFFSVDGARALSGAEWSRMRAKFSCPLGVTNVWPHPAVRGGERVRSEGKILHTNQKPLALMDLAVEASTEPGDVVWEPFGGLCSASASAMRLGRTAFAAELQRPFFEASIHRLSAHARRPDPRTAARGVEPTARHALFSAP